jgi:hypothetical protein
MRLGSLRSATEQQLAILASEASRKRPVRVRGREPRYLYWMQGVDTDGTALDMPDNTKDFEAIILPFKCLVTTVSLFSTAGTYTVQLRLSGTLTGEEYTSAMTYPRPVRPALLVPPGERLALYLKTKSTSPTVAGFIARFTLREV